MQNLLVALCKHAIQNWPLLLVLIDREYLSSTFECFPESYSIKGSSDRVMATLRAM